MRMLDLCSGTGSASRAALVRGWEVVRVDNARGMAADVRADIAVWSPPPGLLWDLVWASPPCTRFSTANADHRDVAAGMVLVEAAVRIIREARPRWWVLENVHGSVRAIGDLLGPPVQRHGAVYLWGNFPPFTAPAHRKTAQGRQRARANAATPWAISEGLVKACELLAAELRGSGEHFGASSGPARVPDGPGSEPAGARLGASSGPSRTPAGPGCPGLTQ